jgi:cytochrome P450
VALNEPFNQAIQGTTLASDPPTHDELRNIVASSLTPRALTSRKAAIDELADRLVEQVVARGSFDAVADLARPLPLSVVPDFIGLPPDGREKMLDWAVATFNVIGPMNERAQQGFTVIEEMVNYAIERITSRDLTPGSLGAGVLAAAESGRISFEQAPRLLIDYFSPSIDTTISGLGNAIWLFARNPEQWDTLRENPDLIPNAFNEAIRVETPIRGFCRHTRTACDFEGVPLAEGDAVLVLYAAANRDERKWDHPDTFDITRKCSDHVGFGFGVHGCAGQGLARLESHAVLEALAKRVKRITVNSTRRATNNVIRAFDSLEVTVS